MLKQKYFLADIFILSAEKQPIKLSWRKIECLHNAFPLADDIMEPYRPFVDYAVKQIYDFSSDENMSKDVKQILIRVLFSDVKIKGQMRPLQVALSMTTASLVRALKDKKECLLFPSFI